MTLTTTELALICAAAVLLVLLNAVFVATEFSLVKLRFTRFDSKQVEEAKRSKGIAALLNDMHGSFRLLRLGIISCTVALGFLLVPLGSSLSDALGWASAAPRRGLLAGCFLLAVALHFCLGELVPRALALQYPVQSLHSTTFFIRVFRVLVAPVAALLNALSAVMLRLLRLDPAADLNLLDVEAQIRSLVSDGGELPPLAENIVNNALQLRKRVAHDVMIPRNQLRYFDLEDSIEENLKVAQSTGHTRFPLCEGDLDHCVGIIHIKDVFRMGKPPEEIDLRKLNRPMLRFSADDTLDVVLQGFLKQRKHFALLSDEFGGAVGAITLEDVLEELVGEIQDEFDSDLEMVRKIEKGYFLVDGLTPLHDLAESIGVELEAEEVSTFGGYVTFELGRMPKPNETIRIGCLEVTITNMDERRVIAATVRILKEEEAEAEEAAGGEEKPAAEERKEGS